MAKKCFNLASWLANFLIGNCRRERDWGPGLVNSYIHALNPLSTYLMAIDFNALNSFAESRPDWGQSKGLVMQCMNYPHSFRPPAAALKRLETRVPCRLFQHQCGKLVKGKGQREYLCCAWRKLKGQRRRYSVDTRLLTLFLTVAVAAGFPCPQGRIFFFIIIIFLFL